MDEMGVNTSTITLMQIQWTHAPDDRNVEVEPILELIKHVFEKDPLTKQGADVGYSKDDTSEVGKLQGATKAASERDDEEEDDNSGDDEEEDDNSDNEEEDDNKKPVPVEKHDLDPSLAYVIQKVSCELTCKCSAGDVYAITMRILNMLSSYSWDAKVAIALGALAIAYGEFRLVVNLYDTDSIAKSVATLKQLPGSEKQSNKLSTKLEALKNLIDAMWDVNKTIMDSKNLSSKEQLPLSIATKLIPEAAYWTITGVVACATLIAGDEYTTTEASSHADKGKDIHIFLEEQLKLFNVEIGEKKNRKAYYDLVREFELPQPDKIKIIFKHLTYIKDGTEPFHIGPAGSNKRKAYADELFKGKPVLLLISDLELSEEELRILELNYNKKSSDKCQYEIVWVPIIHRDTKTKEEDHQKKFNELKSKMSWYTLSNHDVLQESFIRYIKEVWKFSKKTILVVLDCKGKVVCQNALFMYLKWGNEAFPFTATMEAALWSGETWSFEHFLAKIDTRFIEWIEDKNLICVFGGINEDWIKAFAAEAKNAAKKAGIELKIIYAGKSNAKEETMRKIQGVIEEENLGDYLPNITSKWSFWTRLEGTVQYKLKHVKNALNDPLIKEAMTVLSLDGSEQGWATMWFGSSYKERVTGSTLKESLSEFIKEGKYEGPKKFIEGLRNNMKKNEHHCNRLILPGNAGGIPERVVCVECGEPMEKFFMYRCCKDAPSLPT